MVVFGLIAALVGLACLGGWLGIRTGRKSLVEREVEAEPHWIDVWRGLG
ncbi:MAG TPA: hypothetical protein VJP05_00975 [Acidimicrobiia bacterium]|nr:hypothetical protein [Acidimicrobiia bacterium]